LSSPLVRASGPWLAILAAALLFGLPILLNGALPFGSDLGFASHSAYGFTKAIGEGVLYPRWVDNSNRQYGGPTFIYYSPLPYFAVAAAHFLTGDLIDAFRLVLLLAALFSGMTFYLSARSLAGGLGAAAGAVFYVLAPYHALDLYDRFAFAETMSFIWFPLLFLFCRRLLAVRSAPAWFGLALSYAGLLLTHLVTAYMVLFVLVPYALVAVARRRRWHRLLPVAGAGAAALLCAAVYLVPMLSQREDVHMDWVVQAPYGDWRRNFVYRDEVAHGYAPAYIKPHVNRVATTQLILTAAAGGMLFLRFPDRRRQDGTSAHRPAHGPDWEGRAQLGLALWAFFLQISLSTPVWALVPELGTIQFPWRFGLFQALAGAFLVACALAPARAAPEVASRQGRERRGRKGERVGAGGAVSLLRARPVWAVLLLALAAAPALVVSLGLMSRPDRPYIFDNETLHSPQVMYRVMTEYLPRGMVRWKEFVDTPARAVAPAGLEGPGTVQVLEWTTHSRLIQVDTPVADKLFVRTFAHPGWRAWINGEEAAIDSDNAMRAISLHLAPGRHRVRIAFTATADRRAGAAISTVSLATMVVCAGVLHLRRRRRQHREKARP
jgi:hypothetical protein